MSDLPTRALFSEDGATWRHDRGDEPVSKIVVGENRTFQGPEAYVRSRGVELTIVDDPDCVRLMEEFIAAAPTLWNEDIGE